MMGQQYLNTFNFRTSVHRRQHTKRKIEDQSIKLLKRNLARIKSTGVVSILPVIYISLGELIIIPIKN